MADPDTDTLAEIRKVLGAASDLDDVAGWLGTEISKESPARALLVSYLTELDTFGGEVSRRSRAALERLR